MTSAVKHDRSTHRIVLACDCGEAISLPDAGESRHDCRCGVVWRYGYAAGRQLLTSTRTTFSSDCRISIGFGGPPLARAVRYQEVGQSGPAGGSCRAQHGG